jgi:predicted dehydrogenase
LRDVRLTTVVHHAASSAASSWEALLQNHGASFDAVLIHTPLDQRADIACRAAAAGKHVFVNSPMARSAGEAEGVIATCQSAGVKLMIGGTERFRPSFAGVKQALDSRKLGEPALLRVHSWEPRRNDMRETSQSASELHGDVIWSGAAQQLDLAQWMFRGLPTEIFVLGRNVRSGSPGGPEYLQIHLGFPRGGMALISLARTLPAGEGYDSLSLAGSTGAAYADDHYQRQLLYRGGTPLALKTGEGIVAVTSQVREFIDAIAANRDPSVTGSDGKLALQLTEAAHRSWNDGRPVCLEGGLDAIRT